MTMPVRPTIRRRMARSVFWRVVGRTAGIPLSAAQSDLGTPTGTCDSLADVGLRARAWARSLPRCYDIFLGTDRATMLAANVLACRLGRAIAPGEPFADGHYWMSGQVKDRTLRTALLVVNTHPREAQGVLDRIRKAHPELAVEIGLLFPPNGEPPRCVDAPQ